MKNKITKRDVVWSLLIITPVIWYHGFIETKALFTDIILTDIQKPVIKTVVVEKTVYKDVYPGTVREISAYNSVPEQTDSTPCDGAYGNVCNYDGCVVATNAFPKKSILLIDGVGECIVLDRMNKRYPNRVDIFMGNDVNRARQFGVQKLMVRLIK